MPRNLVLYGLAAIAGVVVYVTLRSLLGSEVMLVVSAIGLAIVGVVIYRNLQTNRKVAEASPEQRSEALGFTIPAGRAALYIYRNQFVGRAVGINVLIGGREVAQLKSPRFTRIMLTPGAHRIAGYTGTNKAPAPGEGIELVANGGEIYVAKCEVEPQMVGATIKFSPVALDTARADLQKIKKMVIPDITEV